MRFENRKTGWGGPVVARLRDAARFLRDDAGSATVEHALWLPVFASIIGLTVDASLSFHTHGRMWDAARDVARRLSVAELAPAQADAYVSGLLPTTADYSVRVWQTAGDLPTVTVQIVARSADVSIFGSLDLLSIDELSAVYTMRREVVPEDEENADEDEAI